jgi:hypothetical protein
MTPDPLARLIAQTIRVSDARVQRLRDDLVARLRGFARLDPTVTDAGEQGPGKFEWSHVPRLVAVSQALIAQWAKDWLAALPEELTAAADLGATAPVTLLVAGARKALREAIAGPDQALLYRLGLDLTTVAPLAVQRVLDVFALDLIQGLSTDVTQTLSTLFRTAVAQSVNPFVLMQQVTGVLTGAGAADLGRLRGRVVSTVATRAEVIVRTEMGRAFNTATDLRQQQLGDQVPGVQKRWLALRDKRTRPAHTAIDRETEARPIPIADAFMVGGERLRYPHDPAGSLENTINCVLEGTRVAGRFLGGLKAWYAGRLVEVETRRGYRLAMTVNHPVLTLRGLVPADRLHEGDYVLSERVYGDRTAAGRDDQDQHGIPRVEEVFETLRARGPSRIHRPGRLDLDGDVAFVRGEIDLVIGLAPLDGDALGHAGLMLERVAQPGQRMDQGALVGADRAAATTTSRVSEGLASTPGGRELPEHRVAVQPEPAPFQGFRFGAGAGVPVMAPENPDDRATGTALQSGQGQHAEAVLEGGDQARLRLERHDALCFGRAAELDIVLPEHARHDLGRSAQFAGELLARHAGLVTPDEIVRVGHREFAGHVYDLQSPLGYYMTGGLVSRNCRCRVITVFPAAVMRKLAA